MIYEINDNPSDMNERLKRLEIFHSIRLDDRDRLLNEVDGKLNILIVILGLCTICLTILGSVKFLGWLYE